MVPFYIFYRNIGFVFCKLICAWRTNNDTIENSQSTLILIVVNSVFISILVVGIPQWKHSFGILQYINQSAHQILTQSQSGETWNGKYRWKLNSNSQFKFKTRNIEILIQIHIEVKLQNWN